MKRLYSLAVALGTAVLASAQITGISIETVMVHDGSVDASLDGYTTYHVYADLSSDVDFVSAVFGDLYGLSMGHLKQQQLADVHREFSFQVVQR